jgi:hypothetical protein
MNKAFAMYGSPSNEPINALLEFWKEQREK